MIEINNLTNGFVNQKFLKGVAENVLKGENRKEGNLSVVLVGITRMRNLNKKYRQKDQPTDVLSFSRPDRFPFVPESEIGEIVICLQIIKKNVKKFNLHYNKELARVLIHGILHLLGYKHEKSEKDAQEMFKKQEHYLSIITKY